jgi:hypothetical protein
MPQNLLDHEIRNAEVMVLSDGDLTPTTGVVSGFADHKAGDNTGV